jgi:hypothetical protein
MTYARADDILNNVASACGLTPVSNPFTSTDPSFLQMIRILNAAGQELIGLHEWQKLQKAHTILTAVPPDDGDYDLPTDYSYMINQTGWTPSSSGLGLPVGGPLSPQDWAYMTNVTATALTLFISFRIAEGLFRVFPQPPPDATTISFIYISKNWVLDEDATTEKDKVENPADIVWYEQTLIEKFLKLRFLEAKGFDTSSAQGQFMSAFMQWTGRDVGAPILSMCQRRGYPYLGWRNIPETGYGS